MLMVVPQEKLAKFYVSYHTQDRRYPAPPHTPTGHRQSPPLLVKGHCFQADALSSLALLLKSSTRPVLTAPREGVGWGFSFPLCDTPAPDLHRGTSLGPTPFLQPPAAAESWLKTKEPSGSTQSPITLFTSLQPDMSTFWRRPQNQSGLLPGAVRPYQTTASQESQANRVTKDT